MSKHDMNNNDIHHLAAAYALDAVDETERAAFEAHYPSCDVCRIDVDEFRATLAVLAAGQATPPDPQLKDRVMADIARTLQLSPLVPDVVSDLARRRKQRRRRMTTGLLAAAAALVLVVSSVAIADRLNSGSGYSDAAAAVLAQTDARVVDLDGEGEGQFRVAWSAAAGQAVVIGDGLVDPGEGQVYELWAIDAGGAHPLRLLDDAGEGTVRRVVAVKGSPVNWGVTIEPAQGSDAPTTAVIFAGAT